jgi:mono/diheme cytochrome c family protein
MRKLTIRFLKAIALLTSCSLSLNALAQNGTDLQSSLTRGKIVYDQYCLACHQVDGSGVPMLAPKLAKTSFVLGDKSRLITIVLKGLKDTEVDGETFDNPMPPFDYLTDDEVANVLTYVRNNFTNTASAVKPEEVAPIRKGK